MKMRPNHILWAFSGLAIYVAVPALLGDNAYVMSLLIAACTIGGIALAWALLGNLGGMISFGHAAFFGVGAYTSALLTMNAGVPVFVAMLLGGLAAVLASIVTLPALRLKGAYFALAILAYAQIFRILATELRGLTRGAAGLIDIPDLPTVFGFDFSTHTGAYLLIISLLAIYALIYARIRTSNYGLALRAMHDSEDATRILGVNSTLLKMVMLFLSAFMTGVVGAFNAHVIRYLDPDYAFASGWTMLPVVAAVFGGYRSITGPIVGAVSIYLIDQLLFKNLLPIGHQICLGVLLVAMILLSPSGLLPMLSRSFGKLKREKIHAQT